MRESIDIERRFQLRAADLFERALLAEGNPDSRTVISGFLIEPEGRFPGFHCSRTVIQPGTGSAESLERFALLRNGVDLLFRLDLEPMLDPAQEPVGFLQPERVFVRQKIQLGQPTNRFQGPRLL